MQFDRFSIDGPVLIKPSKFTDARGWFMEAFRADKFGESIGHVQFVQHNRSLSEQVGTVRGLHYQLEPRAQGKLVSCAQGALLDVAVDIRRASVTFGRYVSVELSQENGYHLWVPPGFAHGFVTRKAKTEVFYLVTDYYSAEHDRGIQWNDPEIAIKWGVGKDQAILSEKDRKWPTLAESPKGFR